MKHLDEHNFCKQTTLCHIDTCILKTTLYVEELKCQFVEKSDGFI